MHSLETLPPPSVPGANPGSFSERLLYSADPQHLQVISSLLLFRRHANRVRQYPTPSARGTILSSYPPWPIDGAFLAWKRLGLDAVEDYCSLNVKRIGEYMIPTCNHKPHCPRSRRTDTSEDHAHAMTTCHLELAELFSNSMEYNFTFREPRFH